MICLGGLAKAGPDMPMTPEPKTELYAIVVLGQMNPAIHHPAWYHRVNLIDDSEFKEATFDGKAEGQPQTLISVPTVKVGAFAVTCYNNRWDIRTTSRN